MKHIITAYLVDMADDVQDVIGVVHFTAAGQQEAGQKAADAFAKMGLAKEGGQYHIQLHVVGPLPGTGPAIATPKVMLPQGVDLKHGVPR